MQTIYRCFHCGFEHKLGSQFALVIEGEKRSMCCAGCHAAAQAIVEAGLTDFYRYRDFDAARGQAKLIPDELRDVRIYDNKFILEQFAESDGRMQSITLMLEGLSCDACAWVIERRLKKVHGLIDVEVHYSNLTAKIKWLIDDAKLSDFIIAIEQLGYQAQPYEARHYFRNLQQQRRQLLKRIGVAAGFGMQVMIVSVAMYFGDYYGMDESMYALFTNVALLMTLPVLIYSGQVFFKSSLNQLKAGSLGMDVPVSIGLALAFGASLINTVNAKGHVYFDSVCMFIFFLLLARYFVQSARVEAANAIERLTQSVPVFAERLIQTKTEARSERIIAQQIVAGNWVRVLAGRTIPCDGVIVEGRSRVDRAILTGESKYIEVMQGDEVFAGSVNQGAPIIIEASRSGGETLLEHYSEMAREAAARKVGHNQLTNLFARWFTLGVLSIATVVAIIWCSIDPSKAFTITIAVLVVSCPCALSLATPVTLSVTASTLFSKGILTHNVEDLEIFTRCSDVVFDKTGTLTTDKLTLCGIKTFDSYNAKDAVKIATSLEVNSEHPISNAFQSYYEGDLRAVKNWQQFHGAGVRGQIEDHVFYLGSMAFINAHTDNEISDDGVYLATAARVLARFEFSTQLREYAADIVKFLKEQGKNVHMLTGDAHLPANTIAQQLGIDSVLSRATPFDKQNYVQDLKKKGAVVVAIGDGVNDAPLLACADSSIAVAGASPAAIEGADFVLIASSLNRIDLIFRTANIAQHKIKQNLTWAISYNLFAIPFAAFGLIQPVVAALGMSLSSIFVVVNALRMKRITTKSYNFES